MMIPSFGLSALRFPDADGTISWFQPASSRVFCVVNPEQMVLRPFAGSPETCCVTPEVFRSVSEIGRHAKST